MVTAIDATSDTAAESSTSVTLSMYANEPEAGSVCEMATHSAAYGSTSSGTMNDPL